MTENVTLIVAGRAYTGWLRASITRGLERVVTEAEFEVTEHQFLTDWQIIPFNECIIMAGDDLIMTGYITEYNAALDAETHRVRVCAASKTQDIVECVSELTFQQVQGAPLETIAAAMAATYGIKVRNMATATPSNFGDKLFPLLNFSLDETVFGYLERLARLKGILLTDSPDGDLVLTNAGSATASSSVIIGANVLSAELRYDVKRVYRKYISRIQQGIDAANPTVQTLNIATAEDKSVPRTRTHAVTAEQETTGVTNLQRVEWLMKYSRGQAIKVRVTVPGWRQEPTRDFPLGKLWEPNLMVPIRMPEIGMADDLLLLVEVHYLCDEQGFRTELMLGPIDGYRPDPAQVTSVHGLVSAQQGGTTSSSQTPQADDHRTFGVPTSRLALANNNPGNLKFANQSTGLSTPAVLGERGFAKFANLTDGTTALVNQVKLDQSRGITVERLIYKYAPPQDSNDTELYITQFNGALGSTRTTLISTLNTHAIVQFLARKESGTIIP